MENKSYVATAVQSSEVTMERRSIQYHTDQQCIEPPSGVCYGTRLAFMTAAISILQSMEASNSLFPERRLVDIRSNKGTLQLTPHRGKLEATTRYPKDLLSIAEIQNDGTRGGTSCDQLPQGV